MLITGIDPGINGALGLIEADDERMTVIDAVDMPTIGESTKREIDVLSLIGLLKKWGPDHVYLEYVNAMPSIPDGKGNRRDMGAASAFKMGFIAGQIRACIVGCKIPLTVVTSGKWKKTAGLPGGPTNKEASRQLAIRLFPAAHAFLARKRDEARAEAVLIGRYGAIHGDHSARAA
jgi:hypothetical protein